MLRNLPYNLSLLLLTVGASVILGFLSFGGMFALWPILPLAIAAFALSVAYEGEIYWQNIKGALTKLFQPRFIEQELANNFLLTHFPDTTDLACPQFFVDYEAQLLLLHQYSHKRLDAASQKRQAHIEKTLREMEHWFSVQLFSPSDTPTPYEQEILAWLKKHDAATWQKKLGPQRQYERLARVLGVLSGLFMGFGTTYLLVEACSAIPLFAAVSFAFWPIWIVPMAVIAGIAYGLLTYNAVTDMITNDTLLKWYHKLRTDFKEGVTVRNVFMGITATLLVSLAVALTICTAGTWWTVAKEARPLFTWMGKLPGFIMGVINPAITGLSAIVFNLQNTSESLEMIDAATRADSTIFQQMSTWFAERIETLRTQENWGQRLNLPRIILMLTITPLRILLFFGHLISIGVTGDRVPGIPQIVSAILGIVSEGFEDAHYFISHDAGQHTHVPGKEREHTQALLEERLSPAEGHNHEDDIPTRLLKLIFSPLYLLATAWDYAASQAHKDPALRLTFTHAWEKQTGIPPLETVMSSASDLSSPVTWQMEAALFHAASGFAMTKGCEEPLEASPLTSLRQAAHAQQISYAKEEKELIQESGFEAFLPRRTKQQAHTSHLCCTPGTSVRGRRSDPRATSSALHTLSFLSRAASGEATQATPYAGPPLARDLPAWKDRLPSLEL